MRRMEKITGRTDDMMIIRGVNVFPSQIEELLLKQQGMAPHYQIELSTDNNMDCISVNCEAKPGCTDSDRQQMERQVTHSIKDFIGISAVVNILHEGEVPRSAGKAQRVIDNR